MSYEVCPCQIFLQVPQWAWYTYRLSHCFSGRRQPSYAITMQGNIKHANFEALIPLCQWWSADIAVTLILTYMKLLLYMCYHYKILKCNSKCPCFFLQDIKGKEYFLAFYIDTYISAITCSTVEPGKFICIPNPRFHQFIDGQIGFRVDEPLEYRILSVSECTWEHCAAIYRFIFISFFQKAIELKQICMWYCGKHLLYLCSYVYCRICGLKFLFDR